MKTAVVCNRKNNTNEYTRKRESYNTVRKNNDRKLWKGTAVNQITLTLSLTSSAGAMITMSGTQPR